MSQHATRGLAMLQAQLHTRQHGAPSHHAMPVPGPAPIIGIAPTVIYDRMRNIDGAARELNALVHANVKRPAFQTVWDGWFAKWRSFYEKYDPDSIWTKPEAKATVIWNSDDIAAQTEGYRRDLEGFRAAYAAERDEKGNPLPPAISPVPSVPKAPDTAPDKKDESSWWSRFFPSIPWWGWMLGAGAVGVGGYLLYRYVKAEAGAPLKLLSAGARDPGGMTPLAERVPLLVSQGDE